MINRTLIFLIIAFVPLSVYPGSGNRWIRKAQRLHRRIITIDSHNDTPLRMMQKGFDITRRHDPVKERSKVDIPRMIDGGLDGAFFAVFLSQGRCDSGGYRRAFDRAGLIFDTLEKVVSGNSRLMGMAFTPDDARQLKQEGKRIIFIGIENGYPVGTDTSLIRYFFNRGARYITLCHTANNQLCTSSTDTAGHRGLTALGRAVVEKMNELGMMIDISHASDQAASEILDYSLSPVIASHSCARSLCDNPRNLNDSLLRKLALNGGVIQMCILSEYVRMSPLSKARDSARNELRKRFHNFDNLTEEQMREARREWNRIDEMFPLKLATVSDVADHIDHIVKIAGIGHVGIGTDFDGGGGLEGCFDVSEMTGITAELLRRGYRVRDLRMIWSGNLFRVMNANATIAQQIQSSK